MRRASSDFIRAVVDGPVHLIAESAAGAAGCWLAVLEPALVYSLILVAPDAFAGASHAPPPSSPEAMELRLFGPRPAWSEPPTGEDRAAHPLPVAACRQFVALVTDFIERGDRFVVAEPA
ncbi:MAG: hypothetical protein JOY61_04825 [Chloroflexi bacterium]|nr:hypothetical protein [Chloroflexota bacterium]